VRAWAQLPGCEAKRAQPRHKPKQRTAVVRAWAQLPGCEAKRAQPRHKPKQRTEKDAAGKDAGQRASGRSTRAAKKAVPPPKAEIAGARQERRAPEADRRRQSRRRAGQAEPPTKGGCCTARARTEQSRPKEGCSTVRGSASSPTGSEWSRSRDSGAQVPER
jgi:hypothetical protein